MVGRQLLSLTTEDGLIAVFENTDPDSPHKLIIKTTPSFQVLRPRDVYHLMRTFQDWYRSLHKSQKL